VLSVVTGYFYWLSERLGDILMRYYFEVLDEGSGFRWWVLQACCFFPGSFKPAHPDAWIVAVCGLVSTNRTSASQSYALECLKSFISAVTIVFSSAFISAVTIVFFPDSSCSADRAERISGSRVEPSVLSVRQTARGRQRGMRCAVEGGAPAHSLAASPLSGIHIQNLPSDSCDL